MKIAGLATILKNTIDRIGGWQVEYIGWKGARPSISGVPREDWLWLKETVD